MRRSLARFLLTATLFIIVGSMLAATALADPGDTLWTRMLGTNTTVTGFEHVAAAPNGDVVVTGGSDGAAVMIRYASSGKRRWIKTLGISDPKTGYPISVACDSFGNAVIVSRYAIDAGNEDWLIAKYSPTGRLLWRRLLDGGNKGVDTPRAFALDRFGNVYVTGFADADAVNMNVKLRASDGRLLWKRLLAGTDVVQTVGLALDGGGNMYLTGNVFLGGGNWKLVTRKISAAGKPGWRTEHSWIGGSVEAKDIAYGDGVLYVAGTMYTGGASSYDPLLIKYRLSDGNETWSDFFDLGPAMGGTTSIDQPKDLAVDGKGNAFVAGQYVPTAGGVWKAFAVKWTADKTRDWTHSDPVVAGSTGDLRAVQADGNGGCYVGGTYASPGTPVIGYVAHYAATGSLAWQRANFDFTNLSDVRAMTLVPGGRLCCVGAWRWNPASADIWGLAQMRKR